MNAIFSQLGLMPGVPGVVDPGAMEEQWDFCSVTSDGEEEGVGFGGGVVEEGDEFERSGQSREVSSFDHTWSSAATIGAFAPDRLRPVAPSSEPNKGAHVSRLRVPGTLEQYYHLTVLEEEREALISGLRELAQRLGVEDGRVFDFLIQALNQDSLNIDELPEITAIDYRSMNIGELIAFGTQMLALLILNDEKGLFVGLKVCLDNLYQELLVRFKTIAQQEEAGLIMVPKELKKSLVTLIVALKRTLTNIDRKEAESGRANFYAGSRYYDTSKLSIPERYQGKIEGLSDHELASLFINGHSVDDLFFVDDHIIELETGHRVQLTEIVVGFETIASGKRVWRVKHYLLSPAANRLTDNSVDAVNGALHRNFYDTRTHRMGKVMIKNTVVNVAIALPKAVWQKESAWKRSVTRANQTLQDLGMRHKIDPKVIDRFMHDNGSFISFSPIALDELKNVTAAEIVFAYDALVVLVMYLSNVEIDGEMHSNLDFAIAADALEEKLGKERLPSNVEEKVKERIAMYRYLAKQLAESGLFVPFVEDAS